MALWHKLNKVPSYVNASYSGYTGVKELPFPKFNVDLLRKHFDITKKLQCFEENVIQELKDTRKKPLGYFRALWKMGQNLGTGATWDTKFLPQFPGRDELGRKQYCLYKNRVVSGNDISNIFYGHLCAYMGIPSKLAQFIAKMDACGVFEIISKRRLPDKKLLAFRDTPSDQKAIKLGVEEFKLSDYRLL